MSKKLLKTIILIFVITILLSTAFTQVLATEFSLGEEAQVEAAEQFKNKVAEENQGEEQEDQKKEDNALKEYKNASRARKRERLQAYGEKTINRRITSLKNIRARVQNTKRMTEENKKYIEDEIIKYISDLEALKNKIKNNNDLTSLKEDVKSIFYDYRVYLVLFPKYHGLRMCGTASYLLENKANPLFKKIENLVSVLKDDGKDTANLESLLSRLKSNIENVKNEIAEAESNFKSMKPAKDLTKEKAALKEGKNHLVNARKYLNDARQNLREMREEVRKLGS